MATHDLAQIDADLAEVRANVDHGEAQHNPWALQALRAAEKLRAELASAVTLIRELADPDPDPCTFDCNGGCQAHGFLSLKPGEKCPQVQARELLSKHFTDNRPYPSSLSKGDGDDN